MLITDAVTLLQEHIENLQVEYGAKRQELDAALDAAITAKHRELRALDNEGAELISVKQEKIANIVAQINRRPKDPQFFYYLDNNIDLGQLYRTATEATPGQTFVSIREKTIQRRGYRGYNEDHTYWIVATYRIGQHSRTKELIWKKGKDVLNSTAFSGRDSHKAAFTYASKRGLPIIPDVLANQGVCLPTLADVVLCVARTEQYWGDSWRYRRHIQAQKEEEARLREAGELPTKSQTLMVLPTPIARMFLASMLIEDPGVPLAEPEE